MFTTWDQVKDWITDNNFPHWIFSTKPFGEDAKDNIRVIDSNQFVVSDTQDKLDMTEKYLRMYGDKLYGVGFKSPLATQSGIVCEVRLQNETVAPAAGIGASGLGGYGSIGELRESISREIRATIELENLKKREAEVERREKELDADRQSAMGAIVHYFAPFGRMLIQQKMGMPMRQVAGVDTDGPAHVQPMIPDAAPAEQPAEQPQEQEQSPFTDEEADKLFELMARFKKVEPQYMELLEAVVTMAENGDSTYNMAKGFLVK